MNFGQNQNSGAEDSKEYWWFTLIVPHFIRLLQLGHRLTSRALGVWLLSIMRLFSSCFIRFYPILRKAAIIRPWVPKHGCFKECCTHCKSLFGTSLVEDCRGTQQIYHDISDEILSDWSAFVGEPLHAANVSASHTLPCTYCFCCTWINQVDKVGAKCFDRSPEWKTQLFRSFRQVSGWRKLCAN